jgi:hypothetical protein
MKEKKAVRSGDIYHAGKDSKSSIMDAMLTTMKIDFNSFLNIVL